MRQFVIDWVADLRANEHLQGNDFLHCAGKFCCLGRLCELQDVDKEHDELIDVWAYDGSDTLLPDTLCELMRMTPNGGFNVNLLDEAGLKFYESLEEKYSRPLVTQHNDLTILNDTDVSFGDIATLIEHIERSNAWEYCE